MSELPDRARVAKALNYVVDSDMPWARACAALEAAEMSQKQAREIQFLEADGTQGERAAKANASGEVKLAAKAVETAVYEKELLKARRESARLIIEVWRSLEATERSTRV